MKSLEKIVANQPYPCFQLVTVPATLKHQLKKGMLCLYNMEKRSFDFPIVGQIGPAEGLFDHLEFIGYFSVEDFRDLVFAGRLPINCPSCKGPVEEAGMVTFEVEETGTVRYEYSTGDAEMFICQFCSRPFALMPMT